MGRLVVVLAALIGLAGGAPSRTVSDGILHVPLRYGWSGAVGFGKEVVSGRPHTVAFILAANFPLASDAAIHEAPPTVPPRKVMITLGDFVVTGDARHWLRLEALRLPARQDERRTVSWHGRFAGRGVWVTVTFGSKPTATNRALVARVLAGVRRVR